MTEIKISKNFSFLNLVLLILFVNLTKPQSLCPFDKSEYLLKYYAKGVIPNIYKSGLLMNNTYWEFIHCINGYSQSTYIIKENGEYFYQNSGIFIGSSIDLGKLSIDFINSNLYLLDNNIKDKLRSFSGKFGKEAEKIYNTTGKILLDDFQINIINTAVYSYYFPLMQNYYGIEKIKNHNLEMCLLTFYVKFYGLNNYLEETQNYVSNEQLYFLAYYFLNIKNSIYIQNKLWTLLALSSSQIEYNYQHISFYIDSKIEKESEQQSVKEWLKSFVSIKQNTKNLYTIGNYSGIILNEQNNSVYDYSNFINIIDNYHFNYIPKERINSGIKMFENILKFNNSLFNGKYYQRQLVIIYSSPKINEKLRYENFNEKGINVILLFKITKENNYNNMANFFKDVYNRIPFNYYEDLSKDKNYTFILNSLINFYIEPFYYKDKIIEINRIKTIKKDNIQCFKILYDDDIFNNFETIKDNKTKIFHYFHISLIYNNEKEIKRKYNNNANITFFLSNDYPYTDIKYYHLINYCFNTTVSSDYNKSPFINYMVSKWFYYNNYFYITIIGNDLDYSLRIELLNETNYDNFITSNGIYGSSQVQPISSELIATFPDEKCVRKMCNVDYFSLVKYFSSGIHLNNINSDDLFDKMFDLNMFECLYKNYYCPFFNIEQKEAIYSLGPYLGYGIDLSKLTENDLFKEYIPLYVIFKLDPFLINSIDDGYTPKDILEKYNLILTYEELKQLNLKYLKAIFDQVQRLKHFDQFKDNIKFALFLRATELGTTSGIQYLDELYQENTDKYLNFLMNSAKSRLTTFESLNFQMLLIQASQINKLKKCLLSFVVGKSMLFSEIFLELLNKFSTYRISVSYYDEEKEKAFLVQYFTEDINHIKEEIYSITKNKTSIDKMKKIININSILKQQYSLFKNFDYGIKKSIIIVSTHSNDTFSYAFRYPEKILLEKLYELNINIFDYSDEINFIPKDINKNNKENSYNFYNSEKSEYIQFVPFIKYFDMSDNYQTLYNIINKYPIPINNIKDIYLDLHPNEEIIFEFNLYKTKEILNKKNYLSKYNILKFTFEPSNLEVYFSRNFPFPNNYSFESNETFDNENENVEIYYYLDNIFSDYNNDNNSKFYMTIKSPKKIDDFYVYLELCEDKGNCITRNFYFKFYIGFTAVGILIFFYGIYICFCEITFKKESNIFAIK